MHFVITAAPPAPAVSSEGWSLRRERGALAWLQARPAGSRALLLLLLLLLLHPPLLLRRCPLQRRSCCAG
jgi:hypothetical protein